jgi:hypothetical protein
VRVALGLELKTYTSSHSINPFLVMGFEIESHELSAQAGFEL